MERRPARKWRLTYAAGFFMISGGMAAWSTFHPSPTNYQDIADITEHPVASLLGSVLPAAIGSVLIYNIPSMLRALSWLKACPHFTSLIGSKAVVCKHCHRDIIATPLEAQSQPVVATSPPATVTAVMTAEARSPVAVGNSGPSIALIAGIACAAVLVVVMLVLAILGTSDQHPTTSVAANLTNAPEPATSSASETPAPDAPAAPASVAPPPTVEQAFKIAYPTPQRLLEIDGKKAVATFSPYQLLPLSKTEYVLLTKGQNEENFHAATGYVGITYFSADGGLKPLHPTIVADASDGGWGNPPSLSLIHGITPNPVVLASSSFLGQGDLEASVDLIDLPLDPAKLSIMGHIPMSFSNGGAGKHCGIEGRIVGGVAGAWFRVVYSGSWSHAVTYKVRSGKIVSEEETADLYEPCPKEAEPVDPAGPSPGQ